jgi:hypothetical protein
MTHEPTRVLAAADEAVHPPHAVAELVVERAPDLLGGSWASFSPCGTYRYELVRRWGSGPLLRIVMLNPSKATHLRTDPTVTRCCLRARRWGFPGVLIDNAFALCATDPAQLRIHPDPIGPANDHLLRHPSEPIALTVVAWGAHGTYLNRAADVLVLLAGPLHCLGTTRGGQPRHPLYLAADEALMGYPTPPSEPGNDRRRPLRSQPPPAPTRRRRNPGSP